MAALNEANVEKKFNSVSNTQDSIQSLSLWVIHYKQHHEKIVDIWLKVVKKSKIPHRLTLFYLCNDIVQTCKRKHAIVYKDAFKEVLQDAVLFVRDSTIRQNIERIFNIWEERSVYDGNFISELQTLLANSKVRTALNTRLLAEFQPHKVIEKMNLFKQSEIEMERKKKQIIHLRMDASSIEAIKQLKDRGQGKEFSQQFEDSCVKLEDYVGHLEKQIKERATLIELLEQGELFYDAQYGEAKVVANAYKNFGSRVTNLKKKLDILKKTLPDDPSPVPSPSPDAPSPEDTPPDVPQFSDVKDSMEVDVSDDEERQPALKRNKKILLNENQSPKSLDSQASPTGTPDDLKLSPQNHNTDDQSDSSDPFSTYLPGLGGSFKSTFLSKTSKNDSSSPSLSPFEKQDVQNVSWNPRQGLISTPPQGDQTTTPSPRKQINKSVTEPAKKKKVPTATLR